MTRAAFKRLVQSIRVNIAIRLLMLSLRVAPVDRAEAFGICEGVKAALRAIRARR